LESSGPLSAGGRPVGVRRLEVAAWALGVVLLAAYAGLRLEGAIGRRAALRDFEARKAAVAAAPVLASPPVVAAPIVEASRTFGEFLSPDTSLWSPERVRGFRQSLGGEFQTLAVLRVPKIGLEVPVLEGTDESALNRGVGHISYTPRFGEAGNVGVAGHRDGFFRGLKDVTEGDVIEVETLSARQSYTIRRISIVSPDRVDVLAPSAEPTLTLVTCYPFYFVGDAPRRYIVSASLNASGGAPATERRDHAP
jgi:sortase A